MNKIMKLLGIIVTYFPDIPDAKKNILQFISDVDTLIIWENTPIEERGKYKIQLSEYDHKIIYMGTDENMCIAYALNQAIKYGNANGFTHILTMDQDSCFKTGHFTKYKELVCSYQNEISIFGPNPNFTEINQKDIPIEKHYLITSGNIVALKIFDIIGLFREDYKIDCVDYEFCFRAAKKDFHCFMIGSILLNQEFGKLQKTKYGFHISNYSPFRLFYIARNNIKLYREYPDYIDFKTVLGRILNPFFRIIISEDNKLKKLTAIFKGVVNGLQENIISS